MASFNIIARWWTPKELKNKTKLQMSVLFHAPTFTTVMVVFVNLMELDPSKRRTMKCVCVGVSREVLTRQEGVRFDYGPVVYSNYSKPSVLG